MWRPRLSLYAKAGPRPTAQLVSPLVSARAKAALKSTPAYTGYDREPGKATFGEYSRIVLRVDDVRRAHRELTAPGVRFETEPVDLPNGTFAAIRDPWGNVFGLIASTTF